MQLRSQPEITLRVAGVADTLALASLINSAFNPVEGFFLTGDRINEEQVRHYLERGRYFAAEADGAMLACVYAEIRGERAYIGMLSVVPAHQGLGLGRALMTVAEDYSREHGCVAVDLRVVNRRAGQLFDMYARLGYVQTGVEAVPDEALRYFRLPCHFVTMSKDLNHTGEHRQNTLNP
jgi:GNAT superfamily N-acetyltransferase